MKELASGKKYYAGVPCLNCGYDYWPYDPCCGKFAPDETKLQIIRAQEFVRKKSVYGTHSKLTLNAILETLRYQEPFLSQKIPYASFYLTENGFQYDGDEDFCWQLAKGTPSGLNPMESLFEDQLPSCQLAIAELMGFK